MSTPMRAKLKVTEAHMRETYDVVKFCAVSRSDSYPDDGSDENNTYAKFSPSASLEIHIANPALLGKYRPGDTFYVDFIPAE